MSELVFKSEPLNRALEGVAPSEEDCIQMYGEALADPGDLFAAAARVRDMHKGRTITFSKKVFLNVMNLCRDTCSYCTYKAEPNQDKLSMMDMSSVNAVLSVAKRERCVEALLVTGERPEEGYPQARRWLAKRGFSSTPEYLVHVSQAALDAGLFPHTNAGNLEPQEMRLLAKTNVSLGLMLESSSERLSGSGMPHHLAPSKSPAARRRVIRDAGRLGIPLTTGILVGIGESAPEAIRSIADIRDMHRRHGHIQEIILQNFLPKLDTAMRRFPPASHDGFMILVALARLMMPDMNIQIPPNLSPGSYHIHVGAGINDWGGISPVTPDFVNPEMPWPALAGVEERCRTLGYGLGCRFPVYPEFTHMATADLRDRMNVISGRDGLVEESYWR